MLAVVCTTPGGPLEVAERPDPTPGPGEVVLQVDACGICGSDLHNVDVLPQEGFTMGHEYCGTVVAVGPEVDGVRDGDRAAALSLASCGACAECLTGRIRKCFAARMYGVELPGAYAEYVKVQARDLVALPAGIDAGLGALVEPLAVARHTVERADVRPGEDVLVLGGGPVGLAVLLWLEQFGAHRVVVSDPMATRRDQALRFGADAGIDPVAGALVDLTLDAFAGRPPKHVIECVGLPGIVQSATETAAVDGVVTIAGVCLAQDPLFPFFALSKELDLRYAFYYRRQDYDLTIEAIERGRISPAPVITDTVSLAELPARFEGLKRPSTDIKVQLRP